MTRHKNNKPVILAVDDKEDNLFVMRQLIEDHFSKCEVITEKDPERALILASEVIPDAVLSDVQTPGVDGIEFCRRLKSNKKTAHVPVILITAYRTSPEMRVMGLDAGADDFLSKPIDNSELIAKINVMLRIKTAEDELRDLNLNLEKTVAERTEKLKKSNTRLRKEITQRKETQKSLSESEEKFRRAFEDAAVGMAMLDINTKFIKVNKTLCEIIGYSEEQLLQKKMKDITHPDDLEDCTNVPRF